MVAISRSLEAYEADPPPDRPEWVAAELERRTAQEACPAAARDCIELARDRLRRERGESVIGTVVPVPLALRFALNCLQACYGAPLNLP